MSDLEYNKYLPPYRSLLNPNVSYDYRTHREVQLSQSDLKNIIAKFQTIQSQSAKRPFQKYRSLLSDVKAQMLTRKVSSLKQPTPPRRLSFTSLPMEIQLTVFSYIDDPHTYRSCLYTSKLFYQLSKPFMYRTLSFTSTYRFAQLVTILRLNPAVGSYVLSLDLSGLRPGNDDEDFDNEYGPVTHRVAPDGSMSASAGWRDWKFKNNFRVLHPEALPLTRQNTPVSNGQVQQKRVKISKYFKLRKSPQLADPSVPSSPPCAPKPQSHPLTSRFLAAYASSKDIPIGYVLHVISLCPNLQSLDLSNISLSSDYRVNPRLSLKYAPYDVGHNYHKDLLSMVESIAPNDPVSSHSFNSAWKTSIFDLKSSASSVFSISTFSKPIFKYNSLLPPVNDSKRGDGVLFLSDLNLKSINTAYLEFVSQDEILVSLQRRLDNLQRLNLSSVIWLNAKLVRSFLSEFFAAELSHNTVNGREQTLFRGKIYEAGDFVPDIPVKRIPGDGRKLVLDLSNSGMNKNLPWAQKIDSQTLRGEKIIYQILNNELMSSFEEYVAQERRRRGRAGENYFS